MKKRVPSQDGATVGDGGPSRERMRTFFFIYGMKKSSFSHQDGEPDEPEVPEVPDDPDEPDEPDDPEVPEVPEVPELPLEPEEPELPLVPLVPQIGRASCRERVLRLV